MKRLALFLILALMAATLAACRQQSVTGAPSGDCPQPTDGALRFSDEALGFCLVHPAGFTVNKVSESGVIFTGPIPQAGTPAQLFLDVAAADGRTTAGVAEQWRADFSLPDLPVTQTEIKLGGESALVLDGLTGQDFNRRVAVIHDGRLYSLMFVPLDGEYPDVLAQVEALYDSVIGSWTFLP